MFSKSILDCSDDDKVTCEIFGRNNMPTKHRPQRIARLAKNITSAQEYFLNNPLPSIRSHAKKLGLQRTSLASFTHKCLPKIQSQKI